MSLTRTLSIFCIALALSCAKAQNSGQKHFVYGISPCTWEDFVEQYSNMCFDDEGNSEISEERFDILRNIYDNPININTASREDLLEIPFISDAQADSIISYVKRHRPVISLGELALIPYIDYQTRFLLTAFLTCDTTIIQKQTIKDLIKNGKHCVGANTITPLYTPEGCKSNTSLEVPARYLGDKNRAGIKYLYNYNNELKFGITSEKDIGEPFACRGTSFMDAYSICLYRKQKNGRYTFAIGDYRISLGEGLTIGNLFFSGKKGILYDTYNRSNQITPHTSYSERDYFRGAAGSIRLDKLKITGLFSYKANDAIINSDGEITSLTNTGYHRTITERARKGNAYDLTTGGDLSYNTRLISAGISAAFTRYNKKLNPREADYNKYSLRGKHFSSYSLHYSFSHKNISSKGEIATNQAKALAFINTIKYIIGGHTTITNVLRSYSKKYNTPYAESFKSSGDVNNEQGVFLGFASEPLRFLSIMGYADFYRRPWPTYSYRAPMSGNDFCIEAKLHNSRKAYFSAEWKYNSKKSDKEYSANAKQQSRNQIKLQCGAVFGKITTGTLIAATSASYNKKSSHGWAVSQRTNYSNKAINIASSLAYFNTGSYHTRIYIYENSVKYIYNNFTMLYGNGIRASLLCSAKIMKRIAFYAKYGLTKYFDRSEIGSGAQKINSSTKSDLSFCINITI